MKTKYIISFLAIAFCFFLSTSAQYQSSSKSEQQIDSVYYTCSMHPEVRSIGPGECPKCGMQLIKSTTSDGDTGHKMKMDCGMMQGMDMSKMGNGSSGMQDKNDEIIDSTKRNSTIYTCSMHPEIQSAIPGKCSKCGMELIKQTTSEGKKEKPHKMKMGCGMMQGM